ncbi:leucine-rich repeat-containing protein 71 [Guaruba guarouba]
MTKRTNEGPRKGPGMAQEWGRKRAGTRPAPTPVQDRSQPRARPGSGRPRPLPGWPRPFQADHAPFPGHPPRDPHPHSGPHRDPAAQGRGYPPWVMRRRSDRAPREKAAEEEPKSAGRKEEFQCSGILEHDFPELCARAGITHAPRVTVRPAPSFPADAEPPAGALEEALSRIERKYRSFQPRIQVEREQEDPRSVRAVFLRGWKLEEEMLGVLSQCLPALGALQAVHLWNVALPEPLLPVLAALPTRCSRLRTLSLEGNPLPEAAFQLLMGSDSLWRHLSLRSCSIGDAAAQRIGRSLSTPTSSNPRLESLVLSFNHLSDRGALHIAEGLRLNRSLLSLSLASNDIGDAGASGLAQVGAPVPGAAGAGRGRTRSAPAAPRRCWRRSR